MNSTFEILEGELRATLMRRDGSWPGFKTRAWPQCPWAAAGPGRAPRRRTEPHVSDPAPLVWRAPEGPEGQGGPRDRPLRAKLACGDLAGGRARRRRENPWRHKHRCRSGGRPGPKAPGKPVAPQAPLQIRWAAGPEGARNTSGAASTAADQVGRSTGPTSQNSS